MPLRINLMELEERTLDQRGEVSAGELDLNDLDELVKVGGPLRYELQAELLDNAILVQGRLQLTFNCECVRCLKSFALPLDLPHWTCHLPLAGEEKAVITHDSVDLTPYLREDILLTIPQHPLCEPECRGLPGALPDRSRNPSGASRAGETPAAWTELNKLKF